MITQVAIEDSDGNLWMLPKPNRHHNIIRRMHQTLGKEEALKMLANSVQGFVNDKWKFLTREEARLEAIKCNQMIRSTHPSELFSEDLW